MPQRGGPGMARCLAACVLLALAVLLVGCGSVQLEVGFKQPAELTATAIAQSTRPTPTPKPQLGKLAFVQGGDVWVKELPDGEAKRLTRDGRNSEPRWSASGEWLAFRKDYQVWMVRAGGSDAAAVNKGVMLKQFAWSPVEDRLAYTTGAGSLRVAEPGRSNDEELVQQRIGYQDTGVSAIAWSPDGQWIAFEELEREAEKPPTLQGILRVRADGSETQEVYLSPDPLATQSYLAGWSPDGQSLLFWQGIQMSASLLADGAPLMRVPITGGAPIRISSGMLARQDFLVWSPDGQRLALVDGTGRSSWENKQITSITASGSFQLLSEAGHADLFPAWSPDGRWLAFSGVPAAPGIGGGDPAKAAMAQRRIWIIGRDGTERRQLTSDPSFRDERPRWSRDSDFILFPRLQGDQAQLWLIRADGSDLKKVVDELTPSPGWFGNYGYLDWGRLYDWWLGGPSLAGESHTGGRPKARPSPTPMVAMSPIPNITRV